MATRRGFLASGLAAGLVAAGAPRGWAAAGAPAFLAAARDSDGGFALYGIGPDGADRFRIALPDRGHAGAVHPSQPLAVVFARRPGTFAIVLDCQTGAELARLESPAGRHFMGHGCFSADGDLLYTAENDYQTTRGKIGLWAPRAGQWQRLGEIESHGIGPHDVKVMPDGQTLAVANGGIETNPAAGRRKLNLPQMQPSLVYLDPAGRLLERVDLPADWHRNSIRHLAVGGDGLVAFAMQWEDSAETAPPLLGLHRRGQAPIFADLPEIEARGMQGYVGSVAIAPSGRQIAVSCPRGGRVVLFDPQGRFLARIDRADVCGLAPCPGGFLMTDGLGGLVEWQEVPAAVTAAATPGTGTGTGGSLRALARQSRAWDNHAIAIA